MAEVERLKAEKRAARATREAEAAASGAAPAAAGDAPPPAAYEDPAQAVPQPLIQLDKAEALASSMAAEEAALRTLLAQPHDADGHAVLLKRVTALSGDVGKLQDSLDSISVGELEGEARDAAKARRKAVNAVLEATLMPGIASLRTVAVKA